MNDDEKEKIRAHYRRKGFSEERIEEMLKIAEKRDDKEAAVKNEHVPMIKMSKEKGPSTRDYILVSMAFAIWGIIMLVIGVAITDETSYGSYWGVLKNSIAGAIDMAGIICIIFIPISCWYSLREITSRPSLFDNNGRTTAWEYICAYIGMTIVAIVVGIIFILIGDGIIYLYYIYLREFIGSYIVTNILSWMTSVGDVVIFISPVISWYYIWAEKFLEQESGDMK